MAITQMQASYRADEDRVFLALQTNEHESLRFAFTRKVCQEILESMDELFAQQPVVEMSPNHVQMQKPEKKRSKVMKQFAVEQKYPLGKRHVLVTDYTLKLDDGDMAKVHLSCANKKEIEFQVNFPTFQDLLSLLAQVIEDADWGLIDVASRSKFIHNSPDSTKFLN